MNTVEADIMQENKLEESERLPQFASEDYRGTLLSHKESGQFRQTETDKNYEKQNTSFNGPEFDTIRSKTNSLTASSPYLVRGIGDTDSNITG